MRICTATLGLLLAAGFAFAQPTKPTASKDKAEPPKTTVVTLDGLKSAPPASWKAEKPDNLLRAYQFKAPRADGDKEDATVYVLTTVQGTPSDNIAMLKELFILPTSIPKDQAVREFQIKNSKATLTCIDIRGTYRVKNKPIDTAIKEVRPDYRMIAAVWVSKDASYAIRIIGPAKTVERHAKQFEEWLRNFK